MILVNLEIVIIELGEIYRLRVEYIMLHAVQLCLAQGIEHMNQSQSPGPPPGTPPDANVHAPGDIAYPAPGDDNTGFVASIIVGPIAPEDGRLFTSQQDDSDESGAVSYTHLTLPTIYSV